ncbi:xylulose kinase [Lepeophtheirus salmonis]|uniref:xylulose kinase n=1 Tax=Lepeophtheirus salmonis TaxID=72036 RepID=UPI001AE28CB6|nr:xylulose kinase-like [Lepeophtheirus salmonis]
MEEEPSLYLAFDFSTQQVKAVITDESLKILHETSVHFDTELTEYRTSGGVISRRSESKTSVTAPTIMWVKALDILMEKIRILGVDFEEIKAISGSAQQHGSVFWRKGARNLLKNASPSSFLHQELAQAFSILDSPVWMDSSTGKECRFLEERIGGPDKLSAITGSRAFERFTLNQLIKLFNEKNEAFHHTERISLVSSFAASLFLGDYAPIDYSDAGGMNLLDINTQKWSLEVAEASGVEDLIPKLGAAPVPSGTILGNVSNYMSERFGFHPETKVVAFTGDNPSTFAGLTRMKPGDIGISLGTSDTVFIALKEPVPQVYGHVWLSPWATKEDPLYMGLICYKNGSLTREKIRDSCAEGSWDIFSQLLNSSPRGNFGNIGIYFDTEEITPGPIKGEFRFNKGGERVSRYASKESEVRALVESQFLAKKIHAEKMGYRKESHQSRVWVTGGGSINVSLLQVISDVFNSPVFTQGLKNSAAFGSCVRASAALKKNASVKEASVGKERKEESPFDQEQTGHDSVEETSSEKEGKEEEKSSDLETRGALEDNDYVKELSKEEEEEEPICTPNKDAGTVYNPMALKYKALEARIFPS